MNKENIPYISRDRNIKTGPIPVINLPAIETCRKDAPCFKECYAAKQYRYRTNNLEAHRRNLRAYQENPRAFFDFVAGNTALDRFCRWFGSGDIVDAEFLAGMVRVARRNKETKYLAFTKKYDIVNAYLDSGKKFPKNLTIILSGWGASFPAINPHNLPVAYVRFGDEKEDIGIPVDAFPCAGNCANCIACWRMKAGEAVCFKKH